MTRTGGQPRCREDRGRAEDARRKYGITPLEPAKAEDANSYAVTKDYAEKNNLTTLSDLGKLGKPVALAAASDCSQRPDCGKGLDSVYGIKVSKVEPLGFGTPTPRKRCPRGRCSSARWAPLTAAWSRTAWWSSRTTRTGRTPRTWPVVDSAWLKKNPKAEDALNKLSDVLTTEDLTTLNAKVDGERLETSQVAEDYLRRRG